MNYSTLFALLFAVIWGMVWAAFLQFSELGRFLAAQRTWVTVVIGVGGDLIIALACLPFEAWWRMVAIVAASSIGIITRSLINEKADNVSLRGLLSGRQDEAGK